ncbi:MAG TPA: T9SS type A sorting domain-containing protein [Melioribacteraceae bacterium]|nr:T9SS type A sorting domain-containing protein [Melioribacteraceae bacterium]
MKNPDRILCLLIALFISLNFTIYSQTDFEFILSENEEIVIPGSNPWGLMHTPDGPVSYKKFENEIRFWFTATNRTVLLRGNDFSNLEPFPLQGGQAVLILEPSGTGFDSSYAGAYSVIPANNGTDLLMFYHAENHPCNFPNPFMAAIGLARSTDGGITWQRRGQVLSTAAPKPANCNFQIWGVGNPTVFKSKDGNYLYMMFTEWLRGNPVSRPDLIYLARAAVSSDGEPGSWFKYSNGSFSQPGLGGLGTPVINQPPPDGLTSVYAALPAVSYNTAIDQFIVVFQSRNGIHISTSSNGISWDTPRLIWNERDFYLSSIQGQPGVAYPSLISLDHPSQMTTGSQGYLYFGRGYPNGNPPHIMARRAFEIKTPTSIKANEIISDYKLDQNFPNPFNPTTKINYTIPKESSVTLTVFNVLGEVKSRLVNEIKPAGNHTITWEGKGNSSGIYFYRIFAIPTGGGKSFNQIRKMIFMK